MTNTTIPVSTQWALEGKQPDGEGYRILACSTGDLERENFADALSRFQLGELSALPQVSVSYARRGTQPGLSYVAFAIHWYATDEDCYADGVTQRDNQGRPVAYTSYFCLPYRRLAEAAIGYRAMYEALRAVKLTVADGPLKEVPIVMPTSRTPAADDLAVRVAPLLLTGRPVCVLGAEGTSMLERLGFIDSVMELLPYGFRSRMTAATLTRATNRNHRFRLFFSSARRTEEPDYIVNWGDDPNLVPIPDREAGEYFDWLQDNVGPLARLADLTTEMGFGQKDTLQALESVLGTRQRLQPRARPVARSSNNKPGQKPSPPATNHADAGEDALLACAEHMKLLNPTRLRSDIAFLRKFAEGEVGEDSRVRYQDLIAKLRLLRVNLLIRDRNEERLYDALLRMAFGTPLSYKAYCRVEKCAGVTTGDAPHQGLLGVIAQAGMAEPLVSAIVNWHLGRTDEKKLNKWLVSGQVDAIQLINLLALDPIHAHHSRIVCDVIVDYLKKAPKHYQPRELRLALCQHGFLARMLQMRHLDNDQYQVYALYQFLKAAYPQPAATPRQELSRTAILEILNGAGNPPTPALLSAVLMLVRKPETCQLAWRAYIRGSLTLANLSEATRERLRDRIPYIDAPTTNASEPFARTDFAGSGGDLTRPVPSGPTQ
jgi:hypothetical protein